MSEKPAGQRRAPKMSAKCQDSEEANFGRLIAVMRRLLGKGGCPWDRQQHLSDLVTYLLEETHETIEAIRDEDYVALKAELGDLLYQIVFVAHLAGEKGKFGVADVIGGICDKLERRHPHVFGNVRVADTNEVLRNWEDIKMREKSVQGSTSLLDGVPKRLPALLKAYRLSSKAARVGFDWENVADIFKKLAEELDEFVCALKALTSAGGPAVPQASSLQFLKHPGAHDDSLGSRRLQPAVCASAQPKGCGYPTREPAVRPEKADVRAGAGNMRFRRLRAAVRDELGDILFVVCNLARKLEMDPEDALQRTNAKFTKRFKHIERGLQKRGLRCTDVGLDEMEKLWQEAKG